MTFLRFLTASLALLFISPTLAARASSGSCGLETPCQVDDRSYHARVPDNWDGKTPLPVLLHFHGWGRQGPLIMKHQRIAGATRKMGVLLLAPNGLSRSWQFWTADTQDVPFASAVLRDAAKRWPIDTSRIFISGYSYGSAMAWRFACHQGGRINTLLAIAGTLPDQDETCSAPVRIRHVHGTRDNVMDFPFGPDGEVTWPVKLWRDKNRCPEQPAQKSSWQAEKLTFTRHRWTACASGKTVILDIHERGHFIPKRWIEAQLKDLL